jgi:hypothetical protein
MAKLTPKARNKLPGKSFAESGKQDYLMFKKKFIRRDL